MMRLYVHVKVYVECILEKKTRIIYIHRIHLLLFIVSLLGMFV